MTDDEYIESVSRMSLVEWIREVLDNPEYLTDPYYLRIGRALRNRGEELVREHTPR